MKKQTAALLPLLAVCLAGHAQGTAADYNRAYALRRTFSAQNVYHWAHNVAWKDTTTLFHYDIQTKDGPRYIVCNAADGSTQTFNSEQDMRKSLNLPEPWRAPHVYGRQHQRHWMEVDEEKDVYPVVSPDGNMEAYIEGNNVVVHQKGKPYSEKKILSQDGTIGCYFSNRLIWSPDGKYLFACLRQPVEKRYDYYVESSPSDQLQPILHKQEYAKPGDALPQKFPVIFNMATGRRVDMDRARVANQYALDNFQWLPNSQEILMEYNQRGHHLYEVLAMNAATGNVRTIVREQSDKFVNYSRTYRALTPDGKTLVWMSERDNWNHLYAVDLQKTAKGGVSPIRHITSGPWCVRQVLNEEVSPDKPIFFTASGMNAGEDPYLVRYYRVNLDGSHLVCLTPETGNHTAVFDAHKQYLVDTWSLADKAPMTVLRSAKDGSIVKKLENADISKLTDAGWKAPEVFTAKGRDGKTDMWGIIQRPTNFDPSRHYPVIEYIYAGPGDAYTPKYFTPYNWTTTSLAELGFIVVQLDAMGTSWRGKQFEEVCYKNLKDAGFPDRIAWIKAAAKKYPYMDINNVGIYGASAGGQESTTAVLLHGDFYKAAYSACGCHDNRMDKIWWNEQWMGWPVDSSYVECSNVYNAPKLQRPLMLVVGELDDNVDPSSTFQVVNALEKANKDFELVVIPGAHHTMGEDYGEHKRYDFFVKNLLHVDPPKWSEVTTR